MHILEGYGVTETAPVIGLNTAMHCRANTVGRLLSGVEHRLETIPGIDTGGRLHVSNTRLRSKGDNGKGLDGQPARR